MVNQGETRFGDGWISTKDRLPECDPDEILLVIARGDPTPNISLMGAVELALYSPEAGWILETYPEWEEAVVEYWRRIPALPGEELEDGTE